ncbi:hypothetical protein ACLBR5_13840 [Escherichia coli]
MVQQTQTSIDRQCKGKVLVSRSLEGERMDTLTQKLTVLIAVLERSVALLRLIDLLKRTGKLKRIVGENRFPL